MEKWTSRLSALLGVTALCLSLQACGGSSNPVTGPSPVPTPTPAPVERVVSQGGDTLKNDEAGYFKFTLDTAGKLDITVDWTVPANDLDVFLVKGFCTEDQITSQTCSFLATATSTTAKPEKITVSSVVAGDYTVYIANLGPGNESLSWRVVLTTGGVASASNASHPGAMKRRPTRVVPLGW